MNLAQTGVFLLPFSYNYNSKSYTGYKMRKHIAKALKTRSEALKNAIKCFNAASSRLRPPGPTITWEEAVDYTFLAEFDLLQDTRKDIQEKPWAKPAGRIAMDKYFKTLRAHKEIAHLNVEIRRLLSYICDEESELRQKEREHTTSSPILSFHIMRYRLDRERYNKQHIKRIAKLAQLSGFSGDLSTGVPVNSWGDRGTEGMVNPDEVKREERHDERMEVDLEEDGANTSDEDNASSIEASDAALAVLEMLQRAD
jgi:hypothetical protein